MKAQDIDKSAVLFSEYNRIGNSFNLHDQTAPIVVSIGVKIDEYISLQNLLVLDNSMKQHFLDTDIMITMLVLFQKMSRFSGVIYS